MAVLFGYHTLPEGGDLDRVKILGSFNSSETSPTPQLLFMHPSPKQSGLFIQDGFFAVDSLPFPFSESFHSQMSGYIKSCLTSFITHLVRGPESHLRRLKGGLRNISNAARRNDRNDVLARFGTNFFDPVSFPIDVPFSDSDRVKQSLSQWLQHDQTFVNHYVELVKSRCGTEETLETFLRFICTTHFERCRSRLFRLLHTYFVVRVQVDGLPPGMTLEEVTKSAVRDIDSLRRMRLEALYPTTEFSHKGRYSDAETTKEYIPIRDQAFAALECLLVSGITFLSMPTFFIRVEP